MYSFIKPFFVSSFNDYLNGFYTIVWGETALANEGINSVQCVCVCLSISTLIAHAL